ncbi:Extracellular dermal glycoprotein [Heracleum sosnowskyi]|uniref:Extracellular dermal glycoprotein n=1 Tax=Heracleum sosnowskyi TaxID=360622 RepID=A0AAD8HR84_9APIA|nr:Extracellular dermal glycoprotein [Heracleum sosnowskyi]
MPSSIHNYGLIFLFSAVAIFSVASAAKFKQPKPPTAFLFPIGKDTKTLQYYTALDISSQRNDVRLVLDLGGQHIWFNCDAKELSTFKPLSCRSKQCKEYERLRCMFCGDPDPADNVGCFKDSCVVDFRNPFSKRDMSRGLGDDALFVDSTNGLSVGLSYKFPKPFPFSCVSANLLEGLYSEAKGMAGLMNTTTSLHAQLSTQFKIPHKFALCLPSTSDYVPGHMFIGGRPYTFPPYYKDIGRELITAKLVSYPVNTRRVFNVGDPFDEYFIDVKSISVDHKLVSFNASLLSIDEEGYGGTTLSTVTPYTQLEASIYEGLVSAFTKAAAFRKMKRVSSVAPFGACYNAKSIAKSQTGPVVPYIDINLAGGKQHWRFYGANSMVSVNKDVLCLAFVDRASNPRTSVVIGGHQMENYLIEFDLVTPKVGISTSLLFRNTTCSQSRVM